MRPVQDGTGWNTAEVSAANPEITDLAPAGQLWYPNPAKTSFLAVVSAWQGAIEV
jgi:hypothetical protein